jgi:hypothetical protein
MMTAFMRWRAEEVSHAVAETLFRMAFFLAGVPCRFVSARLCRAGDPEFAVGKFSQEKTPDPFFSLLR